MTFSWVCLQDLLKCLVSEGWFGGQPDDQVLRLEIKMLLPHPLQNINCALATIDFAHRRERRSALRNLVAHGGDQTRRHEIERRASHPQGRLPIAVNSDRA